MPKATNLLFADIASFKTVAELSDMWKSSLWSFDLLVIGSSFKGLNVPNPISKLILGMMAPQ